MGLDVLVDSGDQIRDVLEGASTDALVGNLAEPALHHVQPRAGSGNEMQVEAGMAFQPRLDARMFVRPVVVDDQMQVQIEWCLDADQLQEADKFLMAMPRHAIANDRPIQHVQRSEQVRRAIAFVIVRLPGRNSRPEGQERLSAVEGLNLTFLVDAEHQGFVGRIQIKSHHVVEFLDDVVGFYLNPPDKALVLCVDEKSQIQALDRTQPLLPLRPGVPARQTHDYKRNGTTNLFAALNMLDGTVIGDCMPRHRHQEFIRFLQLISVKTPLDLDLHLIVDNYGTHKHPRVQSWLKRHPRFHLHFIPTSSSWLNMVERWFREITDKRIRRGSFQNVPDLIAAINQYIQTHNQNPKVFVWSASVERIMGKIAKCKEALETLY